VTTSAGCSFVCAIATLFWPHWIELVFHDDPDSGSGGLEWAIVLVLLTVSLLLALEARREWRRAKALTNGA
jgi:hypothetical protein